MVARPLKFTNVAHTHLRFCLDSAAEWIDFTAYDHKEVLLRCGLSSGSASMGSGLTPRQLV
jgi:hypothetical protein